MTDKNIRKDTLLIDRELLERIDESAICDGTDATISDDLFTQLVGALDAPQPQPGVYQHSDLTNVRCHCTREYPHDSYDAGFIAGSGMCQICDADLPAKDIQQPQPAAVPEGYALVPVEPTPEMVSAAEEAHMPFGDMDIALRMTPLPPTIKNKNSA